MLHAAVRVGQNSGAGAEACRAGRRIIRRSRPDRHCRVATSLEEARGAVPGAQMPRLWSLKFIPRQTPEVRIHLLVEALARLGGAPTALPL